jgi:hypothetical protein
MWAKVDSQGVSVTGVGITVAVIDTGIDYTHPDLGAGIGPGYKVIGGYDFFNNDSDPMDDNGHGTHVAGIIAADGLSVKGIAPDAKILAYKALGSDGKATSSKILEAMERAMDPNNDGDTSDHADVISLSLGGIGTENDPLCLAVENAVAVGVVVVVAAGNDGPSLGTVSSPGLAHDAITVGAVDQLGQLAEFSSRGTGATLRIKPEICAPGVSIVSTVPFSGTPSSSSTGYKAMSGTSMAAPHVSGAVALLLQLHPDWTPGQVKSAIVTGAERVAESVWNAGAGELWVPASADATAFAYPSILSYQQAGGLPVGVEMTNEGPTITFSAISTDVYSMFVNGSRPTAVWTNYSTAAPSSLPLPAGASRTLTLTVPSPAFVWQEGYYDGTISLRGGSSEMRIPFGFAVVSVAIIHVIDVGGKEVFDSFGGVWAYRVPDVGIAVGARGFEKPAPPATFILTSGNYSIHAAGHQLLYAYSDPYILSTTVHLEKTETREVYLNMTDARQMSLSLEADSGSPIYAKNYRFYYRYEGEKNISFHITSTDYSVTGSDLFYLPHSRTIFVSDTAVTVGISISGLSYSLGMWEFMNRNWRHWYEFPGSSSTSFFIDSTADLEYLLAWEFDGVNSSTPLQLAVDKSQSSIFLTKYDIPGAIGNVWNFGNTHLSMGGSSYFFIRRDTSTSINPFFSGLTREVIVQGVFADLYNPGDVHGTTFNREYYSDDLSHLVQTSSDPNLYLPNRNYLVPLPPTETSQRLGAGPFYPSVRTMNSNDTFALVHPILRDQGGAKVEGERTVIPTLVLYRESTAVAVLDLTEFLLRPDAVRDVQLPGIGNYRAEIQYDPCSQICSHTKIILGFSVPSVDLDPPQITGLEMSQRFVPGSSVDLKLRARDDLPLKSVEMNWRPTESASWRTLNISDLGSGAYGAQIQTSAADGAIHLMIKVSDVDDNYIEYYATNASLAEIPVVFELFTDRTEFEYRDGDASVVVSGRLTDLAGNPLSATGAIPLELMLNGIKVATILDEYVVSGSHSHNGTVRFEWHFNPTAIFSGPNEQANIWVDFDLGLYVPGRVVLSLQSVESKNSAPSITLQSPANGSLIEAGQVIDIDIVDDSTFTAKAYLDGAQLSSFAPPWQISTSSWSDGNHILEIVATDNDGGISRVTYQFDIDSLAPSVSITYPNEGSRIPSGKVLTAEVYDSHLSLVVCSIDRGTGQPLNAPYSIDMAGWTSGSHSVTVTATDAVGHSSSKSVSFEIASNSIALQLDSPKSGAVVRSGVPITFSAAGDGLMAYRWLEDGILHELGQQSFIPTAGWSQGIHNLIVNVTSDMGGWDQIPLAITIDDFAPTIQLVSPTNNSFVSPSDYIMIQVQDRSFNTTQWVLWSAVRTTTSSSLSISLASCPADGSFTLFVSAIDKAGNEAKAEFSFAMDSSPPSLLVGNLVSGDAVRPGFVLNVSASDAYLSLVQWALDNGQLQILATPYKIDTLSMALGWHTLQLVAKDASGKQTTLNMSLYLDDAAPVVGELSPRNYTVGSDFVVTVSITDDFKVGGATLYYELRDGQYANVRMNPDSGSFTAVLPASVLWDGMKVYVLGVDAAGNIVESSRTELRAAIEPSGSGGMAPFWNLLGSVGGIVFISSVALISSISFFFVAHRRNKDDEKAAEPKGGRASHQRIASASSAASTLPAMRKAREGGSKSIAGPSRPVAQVNASAQRSKSSIPVFEAKKAQKTPSLLDSIPEILVRSQVARKDSDLETDYGAMIERELIIPSLKTSIFKDVNVEIDRQLAELVSFCEESRRKTVLMPRS